MRIEPYLFFRGDAEPAIRFYERALGARVEMIMRFRESPEPVPPDRLPPGFEDRIMHASILVGGARIMLSDGGCTTGAAPAGYALSLGAPDPASAHRLFEALADGGRVDMPIGPTFWSPAFGMLTDRFGIAWMVTVAAPDPAPGCGSPAVPDTLTLVRVFRAPAERVWRALLDPAALAKWNAPDGFTAIVHELEPRIGGRYRMTFVNFATGQRHAFGGAYRELVPNERLVATDRFEDPSLAGEMVTTYSLRVVPTGTELTIEQAGLPDAIPADACRHGWQKSLELLARLVEHEIPSG